MKVKRHFSAKVVGYAMFAVAQPKPEESSQTFSKKTTTIFNTRINTKTQLIARLFWGQTRQEDKIRFLYKYTIKMQHDNKSVSLNK